MRRALYFLLAAFSAAVAADLVMMMLFGAWVAFYLPGVLTDFLANSFRTSARGLGGLLLVMTAAQLAFALARQSRPVLAGLSAGLIYDVIASLTPTPRVVTHAVNSINPFSVFPVRSAWASPHNPLIDHQRGFEWMHSFWLFPIFILLACTAGGWIFGLIERQARPAR